MKKLLKKNNVILILLTTLLVLNACTLSAPPASEDVDVFIPSSDRYDAVSARKVCGDQGVESFDLETGFIKCIVPIIPSKPDEDPSKPEPTPGSEVVKKDPDVFALAETAELKMGWDTDWYRSPFLDVKKQNDDKLSHETFAEPGTYPGIGGKQTAWDHLSDLDSEALLVPEAGGRYIAWGGGCLDLWDRIAGDKAGEEVYSPLVCLPEQDETIYLTFVRGLPSDGGDEDRNRTVIAYDYIPGNAISHMLPTGAYFSLSWTYQQITNAWEPLPAAMEWPCTGDNGCDYVYVVVADLSTMTMRIWLVGETIDDWIRVENFSDLMIAE